MIKEYTIGIIGLGYVGLPLAIAFADHFNVVGFDINQLRVLLVMYTSLQFQHQLPI